MRPLRPYCLHAISLLAAAAIFSLHASSAHAQAAPTATRALRLSAFGGATGTLTGFGTARNLALTVGADLSVRPYFSLEPSIEIRGTYPIATGQADKQENVLGGIKLSRRIRVFHPYGDFLVGRGEIIYPGTGYPNPAGTLLYLRNSSNILSPGGGVDIDLSQAFSIKADAQYQRYRTPVVAAGHVYAEAFTLGVVYHFNHGLFPVR